MLEIISIKPLLAVLVSAIGALFILFYGKKPNVRESCSIIAGVLKLVLVLSMIPDVVYGKKIISYSIPQARYNIDINRVINRMRI